MTGGHFKEVCEFGCVHGQCRCPNPSKSIRRVTCDVPEKHRTTTESSMIGKKSIDDRFTYHPPTEERAVKHIMIREHGKALAQYLDENVPDGYEKERAIQRVEEAVMWANAGLARSPE